MNITGGIMSEEVGRELTDELITMLEKEVVSEPDIPIKTATASTMIKEEELEEKPVINVNYKLPPLTLLKLTAKNLLLFEIKFFIKISISSLSVSPSPSVSEPDTTASPASYLSHFDIPAISEGVLFHSSS